VSLCDRNRDINREMRPRFRDKTKLQNHLKAYSGKCENEIVPDAEKKKILIWFQLRRKIQKNRNA
jgi:hypothetical protein